MGAARVAASAIALAALVWGLALSGGQIGAAGKGSEATPEIPLAQVLVDDRGRRLGLAVSPQRIVSLAPHATELLFAAGLGERVVAVDPDSDHPPAVRALPKVGALPEPSVERLLSLAPDLVVAWAPGTRPGFVDRMAALGVPVFVSDPRTLDEVGASLARFASLGGPGGAAAAADFASALAALRARWGGRETVRVFLQIWGDPLITITDQDLIGDAIAACGGENIAAGLPGAAPRIDAERVMAAAPALVVATDSPASSQRWRQLGLLYPEGPARFAFLDPVMLQRPGPRILSAVNELCQAIDSVRSLRSDAGRRPDPPAAR